MFKTKILIFPFKHVPFDTVFFLSYGITVMGLSNWNLPGHPESFLIVIINI